MSEQVINYEADLIGHKKSTWFSNKKRGLLNRYHQYKRTLEWNWHIRQNTIDLDYSKIPTGAIPILINNFNRLEFLQRQIEWLQSLEETVAIIIVDNLSTYPPLLEYYKTLTASNIQVVYLQFNSWRKGAAYLAGKLSAYPKYIITDVDLLPYPTTPKNLLSHLSVLLDKYPSYNHIGLSLEIKDLPDHHPMKKKVIGFESRYWSPLARKLNEEVYVAAIDSTFAMYRTTSKVLLTEPALRTDRPYTLQHMDWYTDPKHYTLEYQYYLKSCKSFATWATELKRERVAS